jgi:hypothetical protein
MLKQSDSCFHNLKITNVDCECTSQSGNGNEWTILKVRALIRNFKSCSLSIGENYSRYKPRR